MLPVNFQKEVTPQLRRRTFRLVIFAALAFFLLVSRLLFLQVFEGERFTYLSENNRIRIKKVPGTRGMVFDRNGELLVDSRPSFDLLFVPEDAAEPEATLRYLARLLERKEKDFVGLLTEKKMRSPFQEIVLGKDIDWSSVVKVETHQLDLPGVSLWIRPRRAYLTTGMAAHLLGYLGEISPKQLREQRENGYDMGDDIGQSGLEKRWEEFLRGRNGGQQVEVDVLGRRVRVLHEVKDVPGYNVVLTLDQDLQETAYRALEGQQGAIVVLDVKTGAVLALVSGPSFDPNIFARGISSEEWQALGQNRRHPLNNRAIQGLYPPGSVFKIIVAIAALEENAVDPENVIFDPGYHEIGNRRFRDWKEGGHGWVNLHKAIVESCDVYFYQLGQRLGVDKIAEYSRAFGLGETTGISLDGERGGIVPDTAWKKRRFGQPWYQGETPSVAIGQGYVSVTPIQMVNMMAAVANGGTLYRPWFVRKVESLDGASIREYGPLGTWSLPLKKRTLDYVRNALRAVVHGESGTGRLAKSKQVEIAGKTGTAQVAEMRGAVVKSEHLPYSLRDHAWFVGYAPAENPEIAVAVVVEHGGHGGTAAAPIAKTVMEKYFSLEKRPTGLRQAINVGETRAN